MECKEGYGRSLVITSCSWARLIFVVSLLCIAIPALDGCGKRPAGVHNVTAEVSKVNDLKATHQIQAMVLIKNGSQSTTRVVAGFVNFYKGDKLVAYAGFGSGAPIPPGGTEEVSTSAINEVEYDRCDCTYDVVFAK